MGRLQGCYSYVYNYLPLFPLDSLVQVVHVDNPGKFFVRYKREVSQFDRMMTQLNAEQQAKVKMRAKEISLGEQACV